MARYWVSLIVLVAIVTMGSSSSGDMDSSAPRCNNCTTENETVSNSSIMDLPQVALSCCELANTASEPGIYLVSGAEGGKFSRKLVSCDTNGGWTVMQRRLGGQQQFNRSWNEYENGFGDLAGEFWYGLKGLHVMTSQGDWEMMVEVETREGDRLYTHYSHARIMGAEEQYKLVISEQSGNTIDFLIHFHGMKFTTFDQDNDMVGTVNCANIYEGGWWYSPSCRGDKSLILNKHYSKTGHLEWKRYTRTKFRLTRTEIKIKPKNCLSRRDSAH